MSAHISGTGVVAGAMLCVGFLIAGCGQQTDAPSSRDDIDNRAPVITGSPEQRAAVGLSYNFKPSAYDEDGDPLTFAAAGVPRWATFNESNGQLTGTPSMADVGMYPDIRITISDGKSNAALPEFGIQVAAATDNRKSNPGHYITLNRNDTAANMLEAAQQPGVRGIQKRYYWKELEPSFGNYDFSAVQADLDRVRSQGKMLVVFVEDKTFNGEMPTPSYLQANYTAANRNGGYTSVRWAPYVVSRLSRLLEALGRSIDSHPALEGIAVQESALSLDDSALAGLNYSPEAYRDALIDMLIVAAVQFPTSQVFWYMNYLPHEQSYLEDISLAVAPYGVAMGGPDVLPDSESLVRLAYPLYDRFQGEMTLFNSMQYHSYGHQHTDPSFSTVYWTMDELYEFARDDLHVKYLFWTRKSFRDPADSYMWFDALPVIQANPAFNE